MGFNANGTYTVERNDTLSGIANKNQVTSLYPGKTTLQIIDIIANINNIANKDLIYIGQILKLSGTKTPIATNKTQKAIVTNFGEQSNYERLMYATWSWDTPNTEKYEVEWKYGTGDGVGFIGNKSDVTVKQSTFQVPENATHVTFKVRPISKKYTSGKNEVSYFNSDWSTVKRYYFVDEPVTPPVPSNLVMSAYKLTIKMENLPDLKADSLQFQIINANTDAVAKTGTSKIANNAASFAATLAAGMDYKVKCRSVKGTLTSDWSDPSSTVTMIPAPTEGIYLLYALSSTSVSINWYDVQNAKSYDVEYTATKRYFDSNPNEVQSVNVEVGHAEISSNIVSGQEYFFRVRSVNTSGKSEWSEIKSLFVGTRPSIPTTWSSNNTVKVGDPLYLYWMHNSADGAKQTEAQIETIIDGVTSTRTIKYGSSVSTTNQSDKVVTLDGFSLSNGVVINVIMTYANTNSSIRLNVNGTGNISVVATSPNTLYWDANSLVTFTYSNNVWNLTNLKTTQSTESLAINTAQYQNGTSIKWRVKTSGLLREINGENSGQYIYSDWSTQREVNIYAPPTVSIILTDHTGSPMSEMNSFPFNINVTTGPVTQEPISYFVSITTNESYDDIDTLGNTILINEGKEVFYRRIDSTSRQLSLPILAKDINLKNNIEYKVTVSVSMNSGLSGESDTDFSVLLSDDEYWPNAEITYDKINYTTSIKPYCKNEANVLIQGLLLSVYRIEHDGSFTELITDLNNTDETFITDPHPSLDSVSYRIVALNESTGAMSFYDTPGYPINETSAIIQWDEKTSVYSMSDELGYELDGTIYVDELDKPSYEGSLLKLPYNIEVSEDSKVDVSLINYIGRKHPVSYYGTQLGSTSSWSIEIPKKDKKTLNDLRRLARWTGDVYVREPSGSGYWASVTVSFSQKYDSLTIPIAIDISRVEGGI